MKFQRASAGIIRSIRQVSLFREWLYLRARNELPDIRDFTPDERSGDAADLCLHNVETAGTGFRLRCRDAGKNVVAAFGGPLKGAYVDDCLDAEMVKAARPIWEVCVGKRLPAYAIVASADRNGVPVTVENLYLPFVEAGQAELRLLASIHPVSEDGRFERNRIIQKNTETIPHHFAVIVDPAMAAPANYSGAGDCETAFV